MQEQRTVGSFPEAFEFDHASSSSSSAVAQAVCWNNMLNTGDMQNLPNYWLSPSGEPMSLRSVVSHENGILSGWNLGASTSSEPVMNQTSHDDAEMVNGWTSSLTGNAEAGATLEERRLEVANILSLDNVGINLNSNPIAQGQTFPQNSSTDGSQDSDRNGRLTANGGLVSQQGICPLYNPFRSEVEQSPASGSTNPSETSLGAFSYLPGDADGRPGSSLVVQRLSGKRKNIEGVAGQSSGSGSNSFFQQIENGSLQNVPSRNVSSSSLSVSISSNTLPNVNPSEEHLNKRCNTGSRAAASEYLSSASAAESAESSQRNFRMRINPAHQADSCIPNLWASGNPSRCPGVWSSHQPSSSLTPLNNSLETGPTIPSTSSENQSHLPCISGVPHIIPPLPWNGTSNPRIGSYSNSPAISGERAATIREGGHSRIMQRNNNSEHSISFPADESRNVAQGPTNWSLVNGNIGVPGNIASTSQVGSSSGVHPSISPGWLPPQNPPGHYPQGLSGFVRQVFPTTNSGTTGQLNNLLLQHSVHSGPSQEIAPQAGPGLRTHQHPFPRSAFLMDRRSDTTGASLRLRTSAAARGEGRNRMISEHIRNALDLMLRGDNIRFESVFYGVAELHDRHRDMRLDVDNMSYEELLALEEQIGNVSTGLSEETILNHLKQRKFLCITVMPSSEAEPCCICQEEYADGEDLGMLDCGHDFHAACIKQWLMHKNLCPICKTTALVT